MSRVEWPCGPFRIVSHGNGLAYTLRDPSTGREVYLQGDDAADWRAGYDAADATPDGAADYVAETIDAMGNVPDAE